MFDFNYRDMWVKYGDDSLKILNLYTALKNSEYNIPIQDVEAWYRGSWIDISSEYRNIVLYVTRRANTLFYWFINWKKWYLQAYRWYEVIAEPTTI